MYINSSGNALSPGFIFVGIDNPGGQAGIKQQAPFIMTSDNELIWSGPNEFVSNFRVQTLYDEPVLTYWQASGPVSIYDEVVILDKTYKEIYTLCPKLNLTKPQGASLFCDADSHESYITPRNTIIVTAYNIMQADLTAVGGPENEWVWDSIVVELDIETGDVIFTWSPLAHVPINATKMPYNRSAVSESSPFDWFHTNSVQAYGDDYLVSSRHTWSVYLVNRNGDILWHMDGETGGSFGRLPPDGTFVGLTFYKSFDYSLTCASVVATFGPYREYTSRSSSLNIVRQ